jgi:hypothetical protein
MFQTLFKSRELGRRFVVIQILLMLLSGAFVGSVYAGAAVQPPQIVTQPYPTNVANTVEVRLSVEVVGGGTMSYRWFRSGTAVGAAQPTNLLKFRATSASEGFYHCVIANEGGAVTSRFVSITVGRSGDRMAITPRGAFFTGATTSGGSGTMVRWQIRGKRLWLVNGWEPHFRVLDISNPAQPVQIGDHLMQNGRFGGEEGFDVALVDDTALIAERGNGLGIYDISIPESPQWLGYLILPGSMVNNIEVRGRTAYVGNEEAGVVLLDVNDPRSPVIIGQVPAAGANGVFVDGNRLYVARWNFGGSVFDFGTPQTPSLVASYPVSGQVFTGRMFDVAARNSIVWFADQTSGFFAVDFSQPANPVQLARFSGLGNGVFPTRSHLFGSANNGVMVASTRDTNALYSFGTIGGFGMIGGAAPHGNLLIACGARFSLFDVESYDAPPTITAKPEVRRLAAGASIELDAPVFGAGELRYRWFFNGQPLPSATNAILEVSGFSDDQVGDYSAEATSEFGSDSALVIRLEMADAAVPPRISRPAVNSANRFGCFIRSRVGEQVVIEASEDLAQWTEREVRTVREPEFQWNESGAGPSARFYRVKRR